MLSGTRPYISRASCPTATIFWSATSIATMVGSSESTCVLSASRVNIVPRSIPRSFENIATAPTILRNDFSTWNGNQLHGNILLSVRIFRFTITADHVQPQVGTPQCGFHHEICILILGFEFGKRIFSALFGSLRANDINILNILRCISQYGYNIRLNLSHASCNCKQFLLAFVANLDHSIFKNGKYRSVMRQNAHFTSYTRQNDNIHIALEDRAILRNDFTTNGHSYIPSLQGEYSSRRSNLSISEGLLRRFAPRNDIIVTRPRQFYPPSHGHLQLYPP